MFEEGEMSHTAVAAAFKAKMADSFRHGRPPIGSTGRQPRLKRLHNNNNTFQNAGPHQRRFGSHDRVMRGHNADWQTRQPRNQDEEYWSDSSSDHQQQQPAATSKAEPAAATLLSGEIKRECFGEPRKRLPSTDRRHQKPAPATRRSYDHSPLAGPARAAGKRAELCKYYANGYCARGDKCFYVHHSEQQQPAVRPAYRCSSQEPPPECEAPFMQEKRGRANSLDDYSPSQPEPAAAGFDLQKALLQLASKNGQVLLSALPDFQLAKSSNASSNVSSPGSTASSSDSSVNFASIAALLAFTAQPSEASPPSPGTSKSPQSLRELLGISYL